MMAVAKRGSAKIMTPAADWIRWAQVREPTTRKKASGIFRCSQTIPVRPQNTSRWPRSRSTGSSPGNGGRRCRAGGREDGGHAGTVIGRSRRARRSL